MRVKTVTDSYLNSKYGHKGMTFKSKIEAEIFAEEHNGRLTRLFYYIESDVMGSGWVRKGAQKRTKGWLVTLK